MVFLTNTLAHEAAGIRALLGDVERARRILGELAAEWEARGFRREAARVRSELAELG